MLDAGTRDLVTEAEFREQKGAGWKKKNSKVVLCEWEKNGIYLSSSPSCTYAFFIYLNLARNMCPCLKVERVMCLAVFKS